MRKEMGGVRGHKKERMNINKIQAILSFECVHIFLKFPRMIKEMRKM